MGNIILLPSRMEVIIPILFQVPGRSREQEKRKFKKGLPKIPPPLPLKLNLVSSPLLLLLLLLFLSTHTDTKKKKKKKGTGPSLALTDPTMSQPNLLRYAVREAKKGIIGGTGIGRIPDLEETLNQIDDVENGERVERMNWKEVSFLFSDYCSPGVRYSRNKTKQNKTKQNKTKQNCKPPKYRKWGL